MPEFQELIAQKSVDLLKLEIGTSPNIETYLARILKNHNNIRLLTGIKEAAEIIEPVDRTLGQDRDFPAGTAFFRGGLLGVRVVSEFASRELQRKMLKVKFCHDSQAEDISHRMHLAATDIIHNGEIGFVQSGELGEFIESIEDIIIPDVTTQPFVRRGFGLVMFLAYEAEAQLALEQIADAERNGVDWDQALAQMMGDN